TETEVAGFGKGDRVIHGLAAAHLADHDHIGRLTQGVLQGHFKTVGIESHFALGDDTALVLVNELDRVFDGDDVAFTVAVAVANHGRQRGGLTGAGGTDEDHQATLSHGDILDDIRQPQLFHFGNVGFDPPQHHAAQVALVKGADPETTDTAGTDSKVALVLFLELSALLVPHHAQHGFPGLLRRHRVLRH